MHNIAVIGGSTVNKSVCALAERVGILLAKEGAVVICGGMGGVMECVSRGVRKNGGVVIGILPGESPHSGNRYLNYALPTGVGYLRNFLIIRASEAVIAIDGSTGTTSEAAFALTEGKSVVFLGEPAEIRRKPTDGRVFHADTPEEAVRIALEEAERIVPVLNEKDRKNNFEH
ncbi:MAG TPA: TIGR00725 family protein [Thermoplasmataceae archaeon]|nr:TIGR00725 family protein [Thermoplasmatales archaeon AK]HLH86089.1 TIGR00725 family protein [Thermoplasmataceae archaeon]